MMFGKGNKLYGVFGLKCPRCHEGDLFETSPYNLKKFGNMPEQCPTCYQKYELEPGFYLGAMFVSYLLNIIVVALGVLLYILATDDFNEIHCILLVAVIILGLGPYMLHLSRSAWLSVFVKYNEAWYTENPNEGKGR